MLVDPVLADPEHGSHVVHGQEIYRIADPGQGFRFDDLAHAAVSQKDPTEHMRIREEMNLCAGGFGLLMVRAQVDELVYNEEHNEVIFMKYLH